MGYVIPLDIAALIWNICFYVWKSWGEERSICLQIIATFILHIQLSASVEFCYVIEFLVSQHLVFTDQIMKCTNQSIIFFQSSDVCFEEGFKIWELQLRSKWLIFKTAKLGLDSQILSVIWFNNDASINFMVKFSK